MRSRARLVRATCGLAIVLAACSALPQAGSKGTMPPPGPNGQIDASTVPDFVGVAGAEGVVGYVAKDAVLNDPGDQTWPVYGDDLRTVVGQLMPGRGFVPLGVDPAAIPTYAVQVGPGEPGVTATRTNRIRGTLRPEQGSPM